MLDIPMIRRALSDSMVGDRIVYAPCVDSTNRMARDLLLGDAPVPLLVLTDYQERGRGRRGRSWSAPADSSVLMSLVVEQKRQAPASDIVFAASLAVSRAVSNVAGLTPRLKWPNDVLLGGRKLCGILVETARSPRGQRAIVGVGLNVNFDPHEVAEIPESATSLSGEMGGVEVSREALIVAIVLQHEGLLRAAAEDPDVLFRDWRAGLNTLGRAVTVYDAGSTWTGEALDVRRDGGLQVRDGAGAIKVVHAADVTVRDV